GEGPADPGGRSGVTGIGGAHAGAPGVARSYREARRAADFAAALGKPLVRHDDLGLFALLADHGDPSALEDLVARWLGPLLAHDERRNARLLPTLAAYLDSGAVQQATADTLGVHVSTLKYRLARLAEILGRDLADPDVRFQLQVALAARRALSVL
ncbi:MAG TPA: helix-turn-helix domain-containing protein, partial [Acidimicrobiia bacterium]|nr:helix-turn-helix domain-containing protein [Acidimicrobiia bacterium]